MYLRTGGVVVHSSSWTAAAYESPEVLLPRLLRLRVNLAIPRWKRVTCDKKGDDPKDRSDKGDDSDPGLATQRDSFLTAKAGYDCLNDATSWRRPEAVGWAPLCVAGPLASSLRGLWAVASCHLAMADRVKGGDPKTDHTKRGRLGPRAGIPKRLRPNCQRQKGTLVTAWAA